MPMSCCSFKYLIFAAPLLLGACGEGYESVRTSDSFPYGNERTAGSTIAYVQAKLMPERTLNLEPVSRPVAPKVIQAKPVEETKEILDDLETEMDEIFEAAQKK